ncbi:unnamed protein product [Heterobilharzia americana]|nr:unnamed protein product [Heterobilharzia americana]
MARKNKQQGTLATKQPRSYRPTNMQKKVDVDWIGHILRKPFGEITCQAVEWNTKGKRRVGRPTVTWTRWCEEEMKASGQSWSHVQKTAENRVRWRRATEALCSTRNPRDKY